jgi:hypothetical protein
MYALLGPNPCYSDEDGEGEEIPESVARVNQKRENSESRTSKPGPGPGCSFGWQEHSFRG